MITYYLVPLLIVTIIVLWWINTLNSFVHKNNRIKQADSSISVMLKQRSSLIPNIVASIEKYVDHESNILLEVTKLRSNALDTKEASSIDLPSIKLLSEEYPDLKADSQFTKLIYSLEEMELQIQAARRSFNAAAVDYNNYVQMFPSSIIASTKNYKVVELIAISEEEAKDIDVRSLFTK
ncbi:LemA family protein [Myroides odoratimimus]|uniref:LemA family protein n=1 Tax=Myroides odoratimimus TaxID=76832 RepID=UPI002576ADC8|nr:LemA family protein [Myroides odoratimimus]MDM1398214.1 LemA family protein [Myroides odoratimimus]